MRFILLNVLFMLGFNSYAQISKKKDIIYKAGSKSERHQLDVYYPENMKEKKKEVRINSF